MFDLLATRNGRLAAFCLLYVTEGLPLGYTATFVATLMRQQGVSPAAIGAFVGALYLPWSFKFLAGPVVDVFRSRTFGPRRTWIVATQALMIASLALCGWLDVTALSLFTAVVVVTNVFGAVQDVAIDALAVDTLPDPERGLANGLMFAGAATGQAIGGAGALLLYSRIGFLGSTLFVVAGLSAVLFWVSLWLRERPDAETAAVDDPLAELGRRFRDYTRTVVTVFVFRPQGPIGLVLAILPAGSYALGLALQTNLAVELRLDNQEIANLAVASTLAFAPACVLGGWLSDRLGRKRSLAAFLLMTAVPTVAFAGVLHAYGWIMPVDPQTHPDVVPADGLVIGFWVATLAFNFVQGLSYGTRTALFMDLCDPAVAATQFTAYMAMMNLAIAYTAYWQGLAIDRWGYPTTLLLDAGLGLFGIALLPFVPLRKKGDAPNPEARTACPACGESLPATAEICPVCGRSRTPEFSRPGA